MRSSPSRFGVAASVLLFAALVSVLPGPGVAISAGGPTAPLPHAALAHAATLSMSGVGAHLSSGSAFGLAVNDQVEVASGTLNCRQAPSQSATIFTVEQQYEQGRIVAGSALANGYVWWEVSWDNNFTGWSAEGSNGTAWLTNLTGKTIAFDRAAALSYAAEYWNVVTSDGYFWNSGGTYVSYPQGTSVVGLSGDDCAHFVSSVDGNEPHQAGGGINIPSRVPPTYGEPSAPALGDMFLNNGWGIQVYGVQTMEAGDMINYEWNPPDGTWDHIAVYVGNGDVAAHTNSHFGANWTLGGAYAYRFIHILATTQGGSGVDRPLVALTLSPTSGSAPLTVAASVVATGGSTVYPSYRFFWGDGTSSRSLSPTATHTYASVGTYTVDAAVNDSLGVVGHSTNGTVTVSSGAPPALSVSLSLPMANGTAPFTTSLDASVSGGTPPYTLYAWTFGDGSATTTTTATVSHTYTSAGTFDAKVSVTDSAGATGSSAPVVVTVAGISHPLRVTLLASAVVGTVPAPITFTANASGGSGTYGPYTWTFGDGTTQATSGATVSYTYNTVGTYGASVTVTDGRSNATSATAWVVINAPPGPLAATLGSSPGQGVAPLSTTFTLTVKGGTAPYRVAWNYGDGASTGLLAVSGTSVSQGHTYTSPGTFQVVATVDDSSGATLQAKLNLVVGASSTVPPTSSPPGGKTGPSPYGSLTGGPGLYALVAVVVIAGAGVAAAVLVSRRHRAGAEAQALAGSEPERAAPVPWDGSPPVYP